MFTSRLTLPLVTALMISAAPSALADDFTATSNIKDVLVFKDGASITRTTNIALPAGNHTISMKGLPATLDTDMIRAAFDKRGITVRRLTVKQVHSTQVSDARRNKIQITIDGLNKDMRVLADQISISDSQLAHIKRLSLPSNNDKGQGVASPNEMEAILAFIGKNSIILKESIRKAEAEQRALSNEISRLQKEMGGGASDKYSYDIIINAYVARAESTILSLTYHVDDAEWWLSYDADINSVTNTLDLTQYAQVSQKTGENWTDATITLSTEEPNLDIEAPELNPQFVDVINPQARLRVAKRKVMESEMADYAMSPEPMLEEMVVTASRRINTDFSTSFQLRKGSNIISSPDEQSFELMHHKQKVSIKAVIVPQKQETAFLYGDFTYDGDTPLYAGSVDLFRNGIYGGRSEISTIHMGEDTSFAMGQDSKITVKLIDEGQNKDEKGIFTKDTEKVYRYAYTIENHHDRAFPIEVRAAHPVSVNEKLVIESMSSSTKPTTVDWQELKGVYAWNKDVYAGQSWTIKHHYTLEFPKNMRVVDKR